MAKSKTPVVRPKKPVAKRKPAPSPYAQATKLAQQVVGAQYGALDAETRAASDTLKAARDALIGQLQAGIQPAGQAFDAALAQQQALAQAGAQGLAQANPNAQIQETLQSIGAPVEQQQQLGQLTQAAFPGQGAVLNIQEGTVPGASLVAQKSAVQQFLAGLPAVAGLSGDRSLQGLQQQAALERAKLAGQVPGLALDIQQQQEAIKQAALERQFKMRQMQYEAQQDALDRAFEQQMANAQLKLEQRKLKAALQPEPISPLDIYEAETDRISAVAKRKAARQAGAKGAGVQVQNVGDGTLAVIDPKTGKITFVKAPGAGRKPKDQRFTPTQIRAAKSAALSFADGARQGDPDEGLPPLTYDEAVRQGRKENIPLQFLVPALNRVYPVKYRITKRGLKQINPPRKKKTPAPQGLVGPIGH